MALSKSSDFNMLANNDDIWGEFEKFEPSSNDTIKLDIDTVSLCDNESLESNNEDNELEEQYACGSCKTFTLMYQGGVHVCTKCGEVQSKRLSHEAEYRFYGDNDNKNSNPERVGLPTNYMLPESSLGTLIKHRSYDNNSIKRMVQYNSWHQIIKERSLYKICCKIASCSKMNGLPTIIIERAQRILQYNLLM